MRKTFIIILLSLLFVSCEKKDKIDVLIAQMTLEEKCAQLCCYPGFDYYGKEGDSLWLDESFTSMMDTFPMGSCYAVLRADSWTKKTLETGLHPGESVKMLNMMQRHAVENTRLGIPLLFCEEAPHGHMALGTTVFPTGLGQASTWDPELLEKMGEVMGREVRSNGAHVGYGPVVDVIRDPRWSRVEETMGEDTYLASVMGSAVVRGMERHVCATLKHFAAFGFSQGGHHGGDVEIGQNRLMSDYMPSFEKGVVAGARSVMTSYNTIDGVPSTANEWLLKEVLRGSWQFKGVVFSDMNSINAMYATHHIASDPAEAAALALKAGVDFDLGGYSYGGYLIEALHRGLVSEADIDRAVRNVLQLKYDLGLFEHPYMDENAFENEVGTEANAQIAKQVALESVVLLKNDGVLPLGKDVKKVAVIGPNADNDYNQLGDYTSPQALERVVTMLKGIKQMPDIEVLYEKGCAIRDEADADIEAAVRVAKAADVVVLVVGGSSARDFRLSFLADKNEELSADLIPDRDCGEGYDRSTLDLLGRQNELLNAVYAVGKPVVTVYVEGRPMLKNLAAEKSNALLTMWYPGMEGGSALADVLFGKYNPAGRLPISVPLSVGQIPVFYSQHEYSDYVEESAKPLYPFGYGLSYTSFKYSDLHVEQWHNSDTLLKVTCSIENTGDFDGEEVAQLYVRDEVSSVAMSRMLLKGFKRVFVPVGGKETLCFYLTESDLSVYETKQGWHFEPGDFKLMLGTSSDDIRLEETVWVSR